MGKYAKEIERRVGVAIAEGSLLRRGAPVVVALSGGADSVALLAILTALGYDCLAAHCNFHLRGDESERDMRHAASIADTLGVEIAIRHFDAAGYADSRRGVSLEVACRDLRYRWFDDLLDREGAQAVAVGHHREDRAETFLLNLMRGTGIAGLTSMKARSGNVVRPLLGLSREEIEEYLRARELTWVDDSSNASDAHRRNRIRNTIVPALETAFGGATDAILRTVANLEEAETVYREAIDAKIGRYRTDGIIDIAAVAADRCGRAVLFEMLHPLSFTPSQISDMLDAASASGRTFMSVDGKVLAELSHGKLRLSDAAAVMAIDDGVHVIELNHDIAEPVRIAVGQYGVENFRPEPLGASVAYFDAASIGRRWELRYPRRGDRMVPFGSVKSKLLSDIFAAAKYSAEQKRRQWVLTCDGEIAWLPGLRNSALWSVGPETKRYIRLQYKP